MLTMSDCLAGWDPAHNPVHRLILLLDVLAIGFNRSRQLSHKLPPTGDAWRSGAQQLFSDYSGLKQAIFLPGDIAPQHTAAALSDAALAWLVREGRAEDEPIIRRAEQLLTALGRCLPSLYPHDPASPAHKRFDQEGELLSEYSTVRRSLCVALARTGNEVPPQIRQRDSEAFKPLVHEGEQPTPQDRLLGWLQESKPADVTNNSDTEHQAQITPTAANAALSAALQASALTRVDKALSGLFRQIAAELETPADSFRTARAKRYSMLDPSAFLTDISAARRECQAAGIPYTEYSATLDAAPGVYAELSEFESVPRPPDLDMIKAAATEEPILTLPGYSQAADAYMSGYNRLQAVQRRMQVVINKLVAFRDASLGSALPRVCLPDAGQPVPIREQPVDPLAPYRRVRELASMIEGLALKYVAASEPLLNALNAILRASPDERLEQVYGLYPHLQGWKLGDYGYGSEINMTGTPSSAPVVARFVLMRMAMATAKGDRAEFDRQVAVIGKEPAVAEAAREEFPAFLRIILTRFYRWTAPGFGQQVKDMLTKPDIQIAPESEHVFDAFKRVGQSITPCAAESLCHWLDPHSAESGFSDGGLLAPLGWRKPVRDEAPEASVSESEDCGNWIGSGSCRERDDAPTTGQHTSKPKLTLEEANVAVRQWRHAHSDELSQNPDAATVRRIQADVGCALGQFPKLPAWIAFKEAREQWRTGKIKETQLTKLMLDTKTDQTAVIMTKSTLVAQHHEDSGTDWDDDEQVWQDYLATAETPKQRVAMEDITPAEQMELIREWRDQYRHRSRHRS
jgi:hypothetical protein